jgi:hypothetical protein
MLQKESARLLKFVWPVWNNAPRNGRQPGRGVTREFGAGSGRRSLDRLLLGKTELSEKLM